MRRARSTLFSTASAILPFFPLALSPLVCRSRGQGYAARLQSCEVTTKGFTGGERGERKMLRSALCNVWAPTTAHISSIACRVPCLNGEPSFRARVHDELLLEQEARIQRQLMPTSDIRM